MTVVRLKRALASATLVSAAACGGVAREGAPPPPPPRDGAHAHAHGEGHAHHRFQDAESWAKIFDDPARDSWQRPARVLELMDLAPGMTVADLGAGTGYFAVRLARAVGPSGRVLALDVEADMVKYLKERATRESLSNLEARKVEPDAAGLGAASVDRVLVVDTWHHISGRVAYARALAQALKPKGQIVIVDFTMDAPEGPPKEMRLPPEAVIRELSEAGLRAEVIAGAGLPRQYVVVASR